jgi:sugar phosphate isomerase/epimerase
LNPPVDPASATGPRRPLSLAHLTVLHASPPELIRLAARAGYDAVGVRMTQVTPNEHIWPLISDRTFFRETRTALEETGVVILDVELVKLVPGFDAAAFEPMLAAAAELGARHVLTQAHDPDVHRVTASYAAFCDLAARYGLTSDIEFLTWTEMRDLKTAAALLRAVDRPNSGLCIDSLHFDRSGCDASDLAGLPGSWFHFAQIADAPAVAPSRSDGLIHTARAARLLPGEGSVDLTGLLTHLPAGTPLAIEIPNTALSEVLSDEDRIRMAREALETLLTPIDGPR